MSEGVNPRDAERWSTAEDLGRDVLGQSSDDAADSAGSPGGRLTPAQEATLAAIAERIFPTTDTPGAVEAGAVEYVKIGLADAYSASLESYQRGLDMVDDYCVARMGDGFTALDPDLQDEVLRDLQAGKITEVDDGAAFFDKVRRHVLEGVFGEPTYGGNRDLVGWRLVGFPGQQYGYSDPYINKLIDLAPVARVGRPEPEES